MSVNQLESEIATIESHFSGELSVAAKELGSGESVEYRADLVHPTASVIKIPILVALWQQVGEGRLDLDERVVLAERDQLGGTGILKALGPGIAPTLRDLGVLMTVLSDNTATNLIIDRLGGHEAVNECMREAGLANIHLNGPVDFEEIAKDDRNFGEASCADMMRLMEKLLLGEVLSAEGCEEVLDVMRGQQGFDQAPRYTGYNPWASELGLEQGISFAHKTGILLGMRGDAGAIWLGGTARVAYAVTAQGSADSSVGPENEAMVAVGLVGRALVAQWWPGDEAPLLPTAYLDQFGLTGGSDAATDAP